VEAENEGGGREEASLGCRRTGMSRPFRAPGDSEVGACVPRAAPWALLFRPFGAGEKRGDREGIVEFVRSCKSESVSTSILNASIAIFG
jgi:hypothetical protein